MFKLWSAILIVLCVSTSFLQPINLQAAPRSTHPKSTQLDLNYITALATANRFLQAWQAGDAESGIVLLSSYAKEKATHDRLDTFFSISTPSAYEINHGKQLRSGRYEFPIVLINFDSERKSAHRRFSTITVVRTGNNDWAVDTLP